MFRIYSNTSRSALLRSRTTLHCLQSFHSTASRNALGTKETSTADPTIANTAPKKRGNPKANAVAPATTKRGRPEGSTKSKLEAVRINKSAQASLVEYLYDGLGGGHKKRSPKGDPKRINVVSENLCGKNDGPCSSVLC
jgi:hypothetical protein